MNRSWLPGFNPPRPFRAGESLAAVLDLANEMVSIRPGPLGPGNHRTYELLSKPGMFQSAPAL